MRWIRCVPFEIHVSHQSRIQHSNGLRVPGRSEGTRINWGQLKGWGVLEVVTLCR